MNEIKNVIVIGPVGSGKSHLLNLILEKDEFLEARYSAPCTQDFGEKGKQIQDNVNNKNYKLTVFDTPGFVTSSNEVQNKLLAKLSSTEFNQIILVFKMVVPVDPDLESLLKSLFGIFKKLMEKSPNLFTIVVNQIGIRSRDEDLISFFQTIQKHMGATITECICIKTGESPRNCTFRYLTHTQKDGYQFQDRNFLMVVGQSQAFLIPNDDLKASGACCSIL